MSTFAQCTWHLEGIANHYRKTRLKFKICANVTKNNAKPLDYIIATTIRSSSLQIWNAFNRFKTRALGIVKVVPQHEKIYRKTKSISALKDSIQELCAQFTVPRQIKSFLSLYGTYS